MILIDSNIWNYYFDQSSKEHEYVIRAVEKFIEKEEIVINTVIVMEVSHFLVKNLEQP
jgi:predicted nucleic acid-binding protein